MSERRRCCSSCIGDRHLRLHVFPRRSEGSGICVYCEQECLELLEPSALREEFELVRGSYRTSEEGDPLVTRLREDWALFPKMNDGQAVEFLSDIFDEGIMTATFQSILPSGVTRAALDRWAKLSRELRHENRFFPNEGIRRDEFPGLFAHLVLRNDDIPDQWHRARLQGPEGSFSPEEMWAPPKEAATHGRASPAGIPYLYLASDELTAVSEIRPHTGEAVSIADFRLSGDLSIIDLVEPRVTASPFALADEEQIAQLCADIDLMEQFGAELSRPVVPGSVAIDYVPSQYLSELIKSRGFRGVLYGSATGGGLNLALFDPQDAIVGSVVDWNVTSVRVDIGKKL